LVVLVIASLAGLLASLFVYRVVVRVTANSSDVESEPIVAAAADIGLAETVTTKHVRLVSWPKDAIPAGALRTVAEAEGRVVRSSVVAGEPLLEAKLAPQLAGRGGIMPMLIPEGQRGVTIKVDEAIRESGFVLPNSHVDVLVSMPKRPASMERIAKLILQDVLVLAAGQAVEIRDNKPVTVTTVTLALTPDQAERLALAQTEGRLTLATRNLRDNRLVETRGIVTETLLGTSAPASGSPSLERAVSSTKKAAKTGPRMAASALLPPPKLEVYTVSVVRGGKVTEQSFVRDEAQTWREAKK
jgi:pilus assembly protein CpaB